MEENNSNPTPNGTGWVRILSIVGLPGALTCYLIWWITAVLGAKMDRMIELLTTISIALQIGSKS